MEEQSNDSKLLRELDLRVNELGRENDRLWDALERKNSRYVTFSFGPIAQQIGGLSLLWFCLWLVYKMAYWLFVGPM